LGKKIRHFAGKAKAGGRGALLYTLVESGRRCGLDPYADLCDVLAWAKSPFV